MSTITFPEGYGYVFAVLGGSFFMNAYLTYNVVSARKKYGIKYPALYAPPGHNFENEFNSTQRAHQNTLESYSLTMFQMALNGLVFPVTSATCGAVWVLGRVLYGAGYAASGPDGRVIGFLISWLASLVPVGISFKIAYDLIMKK
jgi:glutathione S-transferase